VRSRTTDRLREHCNLTAIDENDETELHPLRISQCDTGKMTKEDYEKDGKKDGKGEDEVEENTANRQRKRVYPSARGVEVERRGSEPVLVDDAFEGDADDSDSSSYFGSSRRTILPTRYIAAKFLAEFE